MLGSNIQRQDILHFLGWDEKPAVILVFTPPCIPQFIHGTMPKSAEILIWAILCVEEESLYGHLQQSLKAIFPCWICYGSVRLALAIVSQILINLNSIQTNLYLRSFVHVIQFSQAWRISLSFLSFQRSQGRHSNPSHCLYSWAPGWEAVRNSSADEVHLVALSAMSTSSCRLLFLRENFSTFQHLVVEALVMRTICCVSPAQFSSKVKK